MRLWKQRVIAGTLSAVMLVGMMPAAFAVENVGKLICTQEDNEEHTHTELCYQQMDQDTEKEQESFLNMDEMDGNNTGVSDLQSEYEGLIQLLMLGKASRFLTRMLLIRLLLPSSNRMKLSSLSYCLLH